MTNMPSPKSRMDEEMKSVLEEKTNNKRIAMTMTGLQTIRKMKKNTLKDGICSQIKELILTNQMQPGQQIIIDKLAEDFGVSHTPLREALAMLERDGLVELNSYQNPKVANVTAQDVREVYEMRLMVETWAVERAAINVSDEKLEYLSQLLDLARKEAQSNNFVPHLKADMELHEVILLSTQNNLFWRVAQRIQERSIHVRALVEAKGSIQDIQKIIDEHCQIILALRAHDPVMARKALVVHLEAGYIRTMSVIEK